jgi:hypothetical protein
MDLFGLACEYYTADPHLGWDDAMGKAKHCARQVGKPP